MTAPERGQSRTWQHLVYWRNGAIDLDETLRWLPTDDLHAALLLSAEREGELHYANQSGMWHIWDGRAHSPDTGGKAAKLVHEFALRCELALAQCREQVRQAVAVRNQGAAADAIARAVATAWEPWKPAEKYAAGLRRAAGSSALQRVMAEVCAVDESVLDERHPTWLNCLNGTVDLSTGLIKPHDPADMITYCVPVNYVAARCPQFWNLVYRMCGQDYEVAVYLLKALGYALLGDNREQLIFFINGPTKSGKSMVLYIVRSVLGPLAHESQAELITVVRHGRNARTENSIRGKRLITITETSKFMHIDEGQLKRLTGEPVISVDQHYAKAEIKTLVTFTGFVATNDMPTVPNYDGAMEQRISVVPGGPTIPAEQRDKQLAGRILAEEAEGILALLVEACVEYHRSGGLAMPLAVRMETDRYRGQQDTVANFIRDCCIVVTGWSSSGLAAAIPMTQAWEVYRRWARGEIHLGRNEFYDHMARQPGVVRVDDGSRKRQFEGLCWNDEALRWLRDADQSP